MLEWRAAEVGRCAQPVREPNDATGAGARRVNCFQLIGQWKLFTLARRAKIESN